MTKQHIYPIGTPGQPWTATEKQIWQQRQIRVRSYQHDVLAALHKLTPRYEIVQYGELHYGDDSYPLMAAKSRNWDPSLPVALVTGGVHGYETSGILGALTFLSEYNNDYAGQLNLLVVPCVSPWAYERTARWNYDAVDPNRQFFPEGIAPESMALIRFVSDLNAQFLVHVDLHETTDSDESEFGPALAAKNGLPYQPESIPDGFYLVSDSQNARRDFQHAIIAAVAEVTHIAPSGVTETILGFPVVSPGVVEYNNGEYHLCATMTAAPFTTTTEVYPDSSKTSPQECVVAQVVAIRQAITFALNHG